MRLVFVIEESYSYHPQYLQSILSSTKHETVGVVLVTEVPAKYNADVYLRNNSHYLTLLEKAKLAFRRAWLQAQDRLHGPDSEEGIVTVKGVVEHFRIDCLDVKGSVNTQQVRSWVSDKEPDVIISCGQAIFGKKLLAIPKICCINRHSSLLPSYGGVLPVFHAYRKGERFAGASIHTMEEKLDGGIVLAQGKVPMQKNEPLLTTYGKCFEVSSKITLAALQKIERSDFSPVPDLPPESYYAFPTAEDWVEFRNQGGRFI